MLSTHESQALLALSDTRNVDYETLTPELKAAMDSLEIKKMVTKENGIINATAQGITLVKIFKSGLDFKVLFRRLSFRTITKLMHSGFDKCLSDGIHLNVIFRNMPSSKLEAIKQEIALAEEAKT